MKLVWYQFDEMSNRELYDVMVLRQEVFVVEQDCPYLDADGKDYNALHLIAYQNNATVGYLRVLAPGVSYPEHHAISRVVTHQNMRGQKLGRTLMETAIQKILADNINPKIKLSAQAHLQKFYNDVGFQTCSDVYLEDNIPHVAMVYQPESL